MAVTEAELEELLKLHDWSISRSKTGQQVAFSAKKTISKGLRITRYIATKLQLEDMSEADVLAQLNRPPKQRTSRRTEEPS